MIKITVNYPYGKDLKPIKETEEVTVQSLLGAHRWLATNKGWSSYVIVGTDI